MAKREKTKYPGVYVCEAAQDKTFYISYRIRRDDGGFKQVEEVAGRQKRDAMTAARASHIRARRIQGDQLPNQDRREKARAAKLKRNWTINALWQEYKNTNPGLKSYSAYNSLFNRYIGPHLGEKKPHEITHLDIDRIKRRYTKQKSTKTTAAVLELLRRIVNFGTKRGLCAGPGFTIQLPRVSNQKTEDLTPRDMARLLEVIDRHISYQTPCRQGAYMMRLTLLTGMRRSEMFKLTWQDINHHRNNIRLRDAKSGQDEIIPMSSYTARLLSEIEAVKTTSPYVFPGRGGGQLTDIKKQVNRIKAEAGLPADFRPLHGLRHVFASTLVSNGVSLDVVSRLLTHKGRSVTHRYSHIRDDALMAAAEKAGELVEGAAGDTVLHLEGKGS